jgi:hypothetical protein
MKRLALTLLALALTLTPLCNLRAQGILTPILASQVAASASYTGPGDVTSGALAWWGLRAYSSATRGTKAANVCNPSDVACADVSTDATTGNLVLTTIGGHDCTMDDCTVKTLYDKSGGTNCTGSVVCDLTQATIGNRPLLKHNCLGTTLWCMTWTSGQSLVSVSVASTLSDPYTMSVVGERTAGFTTDAALIGDVSGNSGQINFITSANTIQLYSGAASLTATANDSVFHAVQGLSTATPLTGAKLYIDGTLTTGQSNANSITDGLCMGTCNNGGTVSTAEGGFWAGDKSANFSTMNSNQHTYWGF